MGTFVSMPMEATQRLTATSLARPHTLSQHPAVYAIFSVCAAEQQVSESRPRKPSLSSAANFCSLPATKDIESEDRERAAIPVVRGLHRGHHSAVIFLRHGQVRASKFGPDLTGQGAPAVEKDPLASDVVRLGSISCRAVAIEAIRLSAHPI